MLLALSTHTGSQTPRYRSLRITLLNRYPIQGVSACVPSSKQFAVQAQRLANAGGNAQVRDQAASQLQALTNQLVVDADLLAQQPGNSASQGQIKVTSDLLETKLSSFGNTNFLPYPQNIAGEIKKAGDDMVGAAKAGRPTNAAHGQLVGKIQELHTACNLPPFTGPTPTASAQPIAPAHVATGACIRFNCPTSEELTILLLNPRPILV